MSRARLASSRVESPTLEKDRNVWVRCFYPLGDPGSEGEGDGGGGGGGGGETEAA